jgi:hypothetical protein
MPPKINEKINKPIITCNLVFPKGQSDSVYRRRTDNIMAKRKSTKGQTMIYKTPGFVNYEKGPLDSQPHVILVY